MDGLHCQQQQPERIRRRTVVAALASSLASQVAPAVHAQASADALKAFLELSRVLTGRNDLDVDQATRLRDALRAHAPDFDEAAGALLQLITERKLAVAGLQPALDRDASRLAPLPRRIVTAWYTGVVGEDERARCVTFETSLMHAVVRDRLRPPSYCHGPHGSWASKPA